MDPTLEMYLLYFTPLLVDAVRTLETHWEVVIDANEAGILPDIYDFGHFRQYLEMHIKPDPGRAAELRTIEKGKEGWLKEVWPRLSMIMVAASGMYSAPVPKLRHHFGSKVMINSTPYGASECTVGWGYTITDLNLFKIDYFEHVEFIDIEAREKADILQAVGGKLRLGRNDVILTTHDGLWRYQLYDIVEAAGFDPKDGQFLVRFSERRNGGFRIGGQCIPESMLQDAIKSLADALGLVSEFTTVFDNRKIAPAYEFFVELDGEPGNLSLFCILITVNLTCLPGANAHEASKVLKEYLLGDLGYKLWSTKGYISDSTIRIVSPGTFQDFRDWKIAMTGSAVGQVKVPITTMDEAVKEWLSKRVVSEV